MTNNAQKTKIPDRKEWLRDLASGDALYYLANDLASSFFKDAKEPKHWTSEQNSALGELMHRSLTWDKFLPRDPDVSCRAGKVFLWLVMDTDQEPDMSMPTFYSKALSANHAQERTLLVYITEHSCLEDNRWNQIIKTYVTFPADENHKEEINEWIPRWPNFMIVDLENFQKHVPAPEGFFQEFLKILAESRTLDEARKAMDAAVEKQSHGILEELAEAKAEIARLKEELANKEKAPQSFLTALKS